MKKKVFNFCRALTALILTDRGSLPGHPLDLVGGRAQFVEAQGGRQRRERVVLEQAAALEAALPQTLVVLVQVLHGLADGADAPVLVPAALQGGRDARHAASGAWNREPGRSGGSWRVLESFGGSDMF